MSVGSDKTLMQNWVQQRNGIRLTKVHGCRPFMTMGLLILKLPLRCEIRNLEGTPNWVTDGADLLASRSGRNIPKSIVRPYHLLYIMRHSGGVGGGACLESNWRQNQFLPKRMQLSDVRCSVLTAQCPGACPISLIQCSNTRIHVSCLGSFLPSRSKTIASISISPCSSPQQQQHSGQLQIDVSAVVEIIDSIQAIQESANVVPRLTVSLSLKWTGDIGTHRPCIIHTSHCL